MPRQKSQRPALSHEALDLVAARFRMLAEPMRLRLLHALHDCELSVTQLVEATAATQANVSKHLGLMLDAGLLRRRKDGLNVFYAIADPMVFELCDLVCSRLHIELERKAAHFEQH